MYIARRLQYLKRFNQPNFLAHRNIAQFSSFKETFTNLVKGKKEEDEEEKQIVITQQEYKLLNLSSTSSIKNAYLQYKKHISFYHPNVYRGKDREEKLKMMNEVYMKIIQQRVQNYDLLTEEDKLELEMLEKSNFGIINHESKTVTDQLIEYDDNRYEWEPHEPKNYILFLFSAWIFLGVVSFSMERW